MIEEHGRYGYIALYKGKQIELYANSSFEAQTIAAKLLKAKKQFEVSVYLVEDNGTEKVTTITN